MKHASSNLNSSRTRRTALVTGLIPPADLQLHERQSHVLKTALGVNICKILRFCEDVAHYLYNFGVIKII